MPNPSPPPSARIYQFARREEAARRADNYAGAATLSASRLSLPASNGGRCWYHEAALQAPTPRKGYRDP